MTPLRRDWEGSRARLPHAPPAPLKAPFQMGEQAWGTACLAATAPERAQSPQGRESRGPGGEPCPCRLAQSHAHPHAPVPTHSRISSMILCFSSISSRSRDSCLWWASRWLSICCSSAFCEPGRETVSGPRQPQPQPTWRQALPTPPSAGRTFIF